MSKRFTSLLVGALAVVLLGAPVQAQTFARRAAANNGNRILTHQVVKPGQYAEQHKAALAYQEKAREAQATQATVQAVSKAPTTQLDRTMHALSATALATDIRLGSFERPLPFRAPLRQLTETVDEHGIIVAPAEGETKYYTRGGSAYQYNSSSRSSNLTVQDGHIEMVECADGTVYVKDLMYSYANGVWYKGQKEGNTVTFNVGQPAYYSAQWAITISINWADATVNGNVCSNAVRDHSLETIVFQIDGDVLTLQGTSETKVLGMFYDDDDSWNGNCDFNSVWTYDANYSPAATELVQLPEGVQTEQWYSKIDDKNGNITIAFNGNDVYVKGISANYPEAWIKGTINGENIVFAKNQYLGAYYTYNIFLASIDEAGNLSDFVMAYDAEAKTMIGYYFIENAADDKIFPLNYYYSVIIQADEFEEPTIATGDPVDTLPYENSLNTEEEQAQLGIFDANADGKTWSFVAGEAQYSYNSANEADDWLVTPAVYLEAGKTYRFGMDVRARSAYYTERIEVAMGTEAKASALTTVVIEPTVVDWTSNETLENEGITVAESGYYYFGVHAISDADRYYLYVDNIVVELGILPTSPAAPYFTSIVPDPYGLNKATITVVAPSTNIAGEPLTENISIAIKRDGAEVKRFDNVRPEDTKVYVDFVDQSDEHTYQAIAYTADGKRGGKSEVASVLIGLDVPNLVENVVAYELEDGSVNISWDAVTTGLNDGAIVADDIKYLVCVAKTEYEEFMGYLFPYTILTPVIETAELNVNVDLNYDGEQTVEQLAIVAVNGAVEDVEDYLEEIADYASQAVFFVGAPTAMPIEEHFGEAVPIAWYFDASAEVEGVYSEDNSDDEGYAVSLTAQDGDGTAYIQFGKIAMGQATNPMFVIDAKSTDANNKIRVEVQTADGKSTLVKAVKLGEEYNTYKISLADFKGQTFVKVKVSFEIAEGSEVLVDNVNILDVLDYNLTAAISAPESVKAGDSAPVVITVKNFGEKAAKGFTVKLFASDENDDVELLNEEVTEALASFDKLVINAEFPTTIFDDEREVNLNVEVVYADDLDKTDNKADTDIIVKQSSAAAPENVVAEKTANGVKLSWTAPATSDEGYIAIRHFNVTDQYVLLVDDINYSTGDGEVFNVDFEAGLPEGWNILDNDGDGYTWALQDMSNSQKSAHSGNFCLRSDSYDNDLGALTPDNWFVSPKTKLNGTFSFWAWGLDPSYAAEHFAVFMSTDGDNFDQISEEFVATGDMTQYSVEIPSVSVVAYNIYVDGELFQSTTETSIELAEVSASSTFAVSAVYANGKESRPIVVAISGANQEITAIEQIATNGQAVDIYSLDGRMVRRQATTLEGLRGAYIINGRTVLVK
ncbi:MAG: choice-of-anchor J domain-containing protein [Prevotella sp.]|nr:choice-of-anchor J domain-containing protein [Prevotella sp.]